VNNDRSDVATSDFAIGISSLSKLLIHQLENIADMYTKLHWNGPVDTPIFPDVCAVATAYDAAALKKGLPQTKGFSHPEQCTGCLKCSGQIFKD
jgi:hypothetical protein